MPWGSALERREEFVRLARMPDANVSELCRRFGVSRSNGYKWLGRHDAAGPAGLVERSRRPLSSPGRTLVELEAQVLALRAAHPAWGGRKLHWALKGLGLGEVPAPSTITDILRRTGRLNGPGAGEPCVWTRFEKASPNELWQMDFKGHFGLQRGRCHPLTVLDDHSRYALEIGACADEQTQTVQDRLTQVFRRYGLPRRILADNGAPWGSSRGDPFTRLGVWLLDLDVGVGHGRPFHPQTQGKDERFHRTLKAEVLDGRSFTDLTAAQAAFDAWREVYNVRRPHEALGHRTPSTRYRMSARPMPSVITPPDYEPQAHVRTVAKNGWISFKGRDIRVSKAFVGKRLALRATDTDGLFDLCYRSHVLAQLDLRQNIIQTVPDVPARASSISPV